MNDSEDLYDNLSRGFVKDTGKHIFTNNSTTKEGISVEDKMLLGLLGILLFAGAEAVKIVFRRNFGRRGVHLGRIIISFLAFIGISIIAFSAMNSQTEFATSTGSSDAHFITGMLYIVFALYILVQGNQVQRIAKNSTKLSEHTGDSYLLGFLSRDKWSQDTIQIFFEPFTVLAIGIFFCFFDLIGGIPIIFCAISIWGNLLIRWLFTPSSIKQRAELINRQNHNDENFEEIKTD
jgi:hypothetical protein